MPRLSGVETIHEGQAPVASAFLRKIFKGPIIAAKLRVNFGR